MNRLIALVAAVVLLTSCTAQSSPQPTATRTEQPGPPTLREIVRDPEAVLMSLRIADRSGDAVASAWAVGKKRAIVHSDDGFATAGYLRWTQHRAEKWMPTGTRWQRPRLYGLDGLLTWIVPVVGNRGFAVLGGGDGATLFPFQKVSRFADGRWTAYDVPEVAGELGYTSGGVVLPDGRLLVLLDHWSGDRRGRPSSAWHGLWVSDGDDWTSYQPWRPRFLPDLDEPDPWSPLVSLEGTAGRRGVLWVRTADARAYVSRDGATFREVRIR